MTFLILRVLLRPTRLSFKPPQGSHPERSASQIYRLTEGLWRGVEGPRRCLIYPCCSKLLDHRGRPPFFPGAENQELPSILPCPAPTSTFSASMQARFTLASPATCISVSCNIRRARGKGSLRPLAARNRSTLKARKYSHCCRASVAEKLRAAWVE